MNFLVKTDRTTLAKVLIIGLLLAGIYYSTLVWLEHKDWGRADYSYGYSFRW